MTLNNLSNLYRITRQWVRFDQEIQNALNIRQALAKQNPSAFQLDFAVTLINVGLFYRNDSPNKEKSLTYSLRAYNNALPFISEAAEGQRICNISINIWKHWGEDLQENQAE